VSNNDNGTRSPVGDLDTRAIVKAMVDRDIENHNPKEDKSPGGEYVDYLHVRSAVGHRVLGQSACGQLFARMQEEEQA
jgi:hypothetical protein